MNGAVAFVLKGYPRLSETFIAQEIRALEKRGLDIRLYSLRHPTEKERHPVHGEIAAPVVYLPEYLHHEPARVARARSVTGSTSVAKSQIQSPAWPTSRPWRIHFRLIYECLVTLSVDYMTIMSQGSTED